MKITDIEVSKEELLSLAADKLLEQIADIF